MIVKEQETYIIFDEDSLLFTFKKGSQVWAWDSNFIPQMEIEKQTINFSDAIEINHKKVHTGIGSGILSIYKGFYIKDKKTSYEFATYVWIESATEEVFLEWMPIYESALDVNVVHWPGQMAFYSNCKNWYSLVNYGQGLLIPNDWKEELGNISFSGRYGTEGGYMPWFSQIREDVGYMAICLTPWDARYHAKHPKRGGYTHISVDFDASMGKMGYRRIIKYVFVNQCDYNTMCKIYRKYVKERGEFISLKEKIVRNPSIEKMIGSFFVHCKIKTAIKETSDFYNKKNLKINNNTITFMQREEEIKKYYEMGIKKLYLHLDGWTEAGYDNKHPDFSPACNEAGGWSGLSSLIDCMHERGYMFGIHDQYRDYYLDAETFNEEYACRRKNGTIPLHSWWAGGKHTFLCETQAPYYVRKNYRLLKEKNINIDCAYFDVFTCNEGSECYHFLHKMNRKESYEYRNQCFEYVLSQGILSSSEEVNDWSIPHLI